MKRHLWPVVWSGLLAMSPLMAQEPYYPSYGYPSDYTAEPAYDADQNTREFHFNPNNMMNRMGNPMNNMFGSSNKRYDAYPERRYAPPAYPPAYGAYPGYPPPADYGYDRPAPAYGGYTAPYGYPQAQPVQPGAYRAPAPSNETAFEATPAQVPAYQSPATNPTYGEHYNFRPMGSTPSAASAAPAVPPQEPLSFEPAYAEPQSMAPQSYSNQTQQTLAPLMEQDTLMHEGRSMKFRPLDKPGYTPDLDH